MRVIITGGTGLIGSALARSLARDGHTVIVLTRDPAKGRADLRPGVQAAAWDARSAAGWGELADGADAVVNLAGESLAGENFPALVAKRWSAQQKRRIRQSRLEAGQAVLEAIRNARHKPAVLIQASAVGYYGSRGAEILTESSSPGDDFAAQVCREWEGSTAEAEALGVRRAILRTAGVVLSLEGGAFPFMLLPFKFFAGGPLGSGRQYFAWIHIDDEVRAIRFLIDNPQAQGPFNLAAPQNLTNAEFSRVIGRVMKRPAFFPTPAFLLRLLFGEKAEVLLASQRQVPQKLQELGFQWEFPQAEGALEDLLVK